ncbi:KDEL motif-containing protein 2 [Seminavis robusta]|uniref:KDEL motif-containing protein 2 n=1 Tax=Seminavis robusta TaxID=568900 RepID=A0A9N8HJN2_9STRA|nr:KDEL motif-containing protein 2 [Seminavis robusta]|eukprot:Sro777_g201010.1 KDEL motif-containing protein 2 (473) ;mRNA; r:15917-17335
MHKIPINNVVLFLMALLYSGLSWYQFHSLLKTERPCGILGSSPCSDETTTVPVPPNDDYNLPSRNQETASKGTRDTNSQQIIASGKQVLSEPESAAVQELQGTSSVLQQRSVTSTTTTTIRDYVKRAINGRLVEILYWNESGQLDLPPLVEQCQFRNHTEAAHWPFYLSNLKLPSSHIIKGSGILALFPTSDMTRYTIYNWSVPAPIPLLAHTLPEAIVKQQYPWIRLLPTPYELRGDGRRWVHRVRRLQPPWNKPFAERKQQIVYRGSITMNWIRRLVFEMGQDPWNHYWLNATSSSTNQQQQTMPQREQIKFRYQLDIGGISGTTWTSLRWKLCDAGSLVFKVETGFVDWWHAYLRPFEHYIPVKPDLSDLFEQWQWAQQHRNESQRIAEQGAKICLETTSTDALRNYTLQQLSSLPTATLEQYQEYQAILDDSRQRYQQGVPSLPFCNDSGFPREKIYPCPPQLAPENI